MDPNTTNINELPIEQNPPENREMPIDIARNVDRNIPEQHEKHVSFNTNNEEYNLPIISKHSLYEISEINKVIILASLIFLLFNDIKVRNYIMNILVVMVGDILKTSSGGISKIGLIVYSTVYGLFLFVLINLIEIIINKYM